MDVAKLKEIIQRRTYFLMKEDDVVEIYITADKSYTNVTVDFVLSTNPDQFTLAKMERKYITLFDDIPEINCKLSGCNTTYHAKNSILIYSVPNGFAT